LLINIQSPSQDLLPPARGRESRFPKAP